MVGWGWGTFDCLRDATKDFRTLQIRRCWSVIHNQGSLTSLLRADARSNIVFNARRVLQHSYLYHS